MTPIDDVWTRITKFWSVRIQLAAAALTGLMVIDPGTLLAAWNMMPATVRDVMPTGFLQTVGAILFATNVLAIVARGIKQPKVTHEPTSE